MELWAILLISLTFGFFLIVGTVLGVKARRGVPNVPPESIIPPIENAVVVQVDNGYMDAVRFYLTDSSLDEDLPLDQVAKSLSLKRCNSVKYKNNVNIKKSDSGKTQRDKGVPQEYKMIDHLRKFNTLPTPPSTPLWGKRPNSLLKSGSVSSMDSSGSFDNMEEKFSHPVQSIPRFVKSSHQLDRAQAVAFLKSKREQRELQNYSTPPRGTPKGKKLERIPSNEI